MGERMVRWIAAGALTVVLSAATVIGAGAAIADDGTAGAGAGTSSAGESTDSAGAQRASSSERRDRKPSRVTGPGAGRPDPAGVHSPTGKRQHRAVGGVRRSGAAEHAGDGSGAGPDSAHRRAGSFGRAGVRGAAGKPAHGEGTRPDLGAAVDAAGDPQGGASTVAGTGGDWADGQPTGADPTAGNPAAGDPAAGNSATGNSAAGESTHNVAEGTAPAPPAGDLGAVPSGESFTGEQPAGRRPTAASGDSHAGPVAQAGQPRLGEQRTDATALAGAAGRQQPEQAVVSLAPARRSAASPAAGYPARAADPGPESTTAAFAVAAPTAATALATAPPIRALLDVIGTVVFNLYAAVTRLVGGPPILPPNSGVRVSSSTLRLDCGCGDGRSIEVPADWYIPEPVDGQDPPERLIYLQHGFLAAGPWYSHTAALLAEQTNSIVVAPTITSNFLDTDGCWLGADPMHASMARLFDEDNTALADSAAAAGLDIEIPQRVVLVGHSLGGRAVSGIAGHMVANGTDDRLAGVLLLDGVGLDDPARMQAMLAAVPPDIPIYQLAAPVYFWNNFGGGLQALAQARPGTFIGVTLVDGSHVDSMRGGNPLIQFAQELVAGFSRPQNSAAAQILMVDWVNAMFSGGPALGEDLAPGEAMVLDTPNGPATLVALPNTLTKPFLFNMLRPFVPLLDLFAVFEPYCGPAATREPGGSPGCSGTVAA